MSKERFFCMCIIRPLEEQLKKLEATPQNPATEQKRKELETLLYQKYLRLEEIIEHNRHSNF